MLGIPDLATLRECVSRDWSPTIGDPEITGWLTVISYVLCLGLAVAVLRRRSRLTARGLWGVIAGVLVFLAVNKQLDLQTALTATGRCLSRAQGWYEQRWLVQIAFMLIFTIVVVMALMAAFRSLRGQLRWNGLAMIGLAVLCGFVLVRAVGFHHIDYLINRDLANIKFNFLFENAGLLLIDLNALLLLRRGRSPRRAEVRPSRP